MTSDAVRWTAYAVGGFQLLANVAVLGRGLAKIPETIAKEGASDRMADLFRVGWIYGVLPNLCLSVALLLLASPAGAGDPLARRLIALLGGYYVVLGPASYAFALQRHRGLLVYAALGATLLGALAV